jgi:EAL domain-containing protein (putative c-di-GMP-specific phosphodiesterase class I)
LLRELGCDKAQGYHMGRPMPADAFSEWSVGWQARRLPPDSTQATQLP